MRGILLNQDNEIIVNVIRDVDGMITSGVIIDVIDEQIIKAVIISHTGDVKEMPNLGCYINSASNGTLDSKICGTAVKQLKSQFIDAKVNIVDGELIINTKS